VTLSILHAQAPLAVGPIDKFKLVKLREFVGAFDAVFSPTGDIAAISEEYKIRIVKTPSGVEVCRFKMEEEFLFLYDFAPDGKSLAVDYSVFDPNTKKSTRTFLLVDPYTCKQIKVLASEVASHDINRSFSFSPDGRYVVANMNQTRMWEVETRKEVYRQQLSEGFHPKSALLSPDGKWIVSYSEKFPPLIPKLMAVDTISKKAFQISEEENNGFKFSEDSSLLYVSNDFGAPDGTTRGRIKVYRVGSWDLVRTYEDVYSTTSFDVSTKQRLLATGSGGGKFRIFSLDSGQLLAEEYHYKRTLVDDALRVPYLVNNISTRFSPDGTMLVTIGGNVIVWRMEFEGEFTE
jgi:WD40 repeat protein